MNNKRRSPLHRPPVPRTDPPAPEPAPIATVRMQIEVPTLPNYLRMRGCDGAVDIADIPDTTLRELGASWAAALVARADARRAARQEA